MKINLYFLIVFLNTGLCFAQFGEQQIITSGASGAHDVIAADLNGDGNKDVISASAGNSSKLAWYPNNGQGDFGPQQIVTEELSGIRKVFAADLDGDGDLDLLSQDGGFDIVVWFENLDGLGNFGAQNLITNNADGVSYVYAADIDNDGDMDVLSSSSFDSKIAWYENLDGLGDFGPQLIINGNANDVRSVFAADIDGDGDLDVLCPSSSIGIGYPTWYENLDGLGNFGPEIDITFDTLGGSFTIAVDLDNDDDMDVINVEYGGNTIAWFENTDGLGNFGPKNIISNIIQPLKIVAKDFDNDGDIDIASINHDNDGTTAVYWHENTDGLGTFSPEQIISTNILGGRGIDAADLDNDGDMDVLSASIIDYKIAWYENLTILGLEEETSVSEIIFYPNPVKNVLNFNTKNNIIVHKVSVYSALGSLVLENNNPTNSINVSKLFSGFYFVQLKTENGELVKKVIKE
tara:strand:- start:7515 stop:8903 length:1389 start_codon:yes stop_codon:yes gene_type:complete